LVGFLAGSNRLDPHGCKEELTAPTVSYLIG
jgi:hypothetical protein